MTTQQLTLDAITLLKRLIATPSVSRDEEKAADIMMEEIENYGFSPIRDGNNPGNRHRTFDRKHGYGLYRR